ncbi:PH domain-containing protein [Gordonia soli]|uniref:Low molecular weight protein antigen 6 PH domain-containing protein n=1 Tax=Gordonia soli NBRC 108243 TaxID=1223545 RepID=M0QDD3_9ACTN|nr:PH domain-containing protein [Gordonia soli]GAC66336.1 hypothetical protein GS4_02_00460 [Gordonia soli NBRC 108243]
MSTPPSDSEASPPADEPQPIDLPQEFRVQKVAYITVLMVLLVCVIVAGISLPLLGWTLVLPFVLAWWIWRIRTVVTVDGLQAVGTFSTRDIPWAELDGLQFKRWGSVRAVLINGTSVRLPAIAFQDLPRLSAASAGRIPDPYATLPED